MEGDLARGLLLRNNNYAHHFAADAIQRLRDGAIKAALVHTYGAGA